MRAPSGPKRPPELGKYWLFTVETTLIIRKQIAAGLLLVLSCAALAGEAYKNFPGAPLDERTLRAQERVEELYENGEYSRALLIYENDLAPKGDKYAQYTIGYMHLAGKGVPQDRAKALAWYRLAAERGEPALVQARDTLYRQLTPEEIAESNRLFVELWQEIGDNRILLDLIRDDISTLRSRTGTRIPGGSTGQLTVINVAGNPGAERFYSSVQERLQTRLTYLKSNVEIIDIDQGDEDETAKTLESDMLKDLAALDLP